MAALHKRHTHGRVFRGEEARELLMIRKRDSHDDRIRMHVPDGFDQQQSQPQAASVVYVTLPQTFSGPAVYSTLTGPYSPDASAPAKTTPVDGNPNWYTGAAPTSTPPSDDRGDDAATAGPESTQQSQMTTFATATSTGPNRLGGTPIQATSAATSPPAASPASSDGMSGGAKAGLAFGIIAILALAAGLVFLCWKRKRPSKTDAAMNEKHGSFADVGARRAEANGMSSGAMAAGGAAVGGAAAAVVNKRDSSMTEKYPESVHSNRSVSTAPRLSLRPVTQFLPMLGDKNNGPAANSGSDPFADGSSLSEKNARGVGAPANPFDEQRKSNDSINAASAAVAGAAAAAGVAAGHGRTGSGSETPRSSQSGGPGAPGAPGQPNNVHRVQLDFKPSMDDELELVSGALVRLLHEYDDGWALCITMDRSKQGVAPRTCLSKLPVKPRPQGPPPNQGSRPSTPNGQMRGPPPPNGTPRGPPRGPMGPPSAMQPRPLTPQSGRAPSLNDQRPMTPRSNGTNSPTAGTQVPTRKPVPGQAM